MHGSLDEFEFRSDPTTDYGVSCPCTSKKSTSPLFRSPEPKAYGELIVYQSSRRLSVCLYVHIFKHESLRPVGRLQH